MDPRLANRPVFNLVSCFTIFNPAIIMPLIFHGNSTLLRRSLLLSFGVSFFFFPQTIVREFHGQFISRIYICFNSLINKQVDTEEDLHYIIDLVTI